MSDVHDASVFSFSQRLAVLLSQNVRVEHSQFSGDDLISISLRHFSLFQAVGYFVVNAVFLHLAMTVTEMVVMKNIYIFRFSRIAAINENFILTTLTSFNVVIIVINLIIRLVTREYETSPWYFYMNPQQSAYNLKTDVQSDVVM